MPVASPKKTTKIPEIPETTPTKARVVLVLHLDQELHDAVENYQHAHKIQARAKAIRELIIKGLKAK
jgi:hypothetical protein